MTLPISTDPNLEGRQAQQRWAAVAQAISDLQKAVGNAVTYNVPAAPGGGNISALNINASSIHLTGNESIGGTLAVAGQIAGNFITMNPGAGSFVGGIATFNGQGPFHLFIGTVDPGGSASEGDIWVDG